MIGVRASSGWWMWVAAAALLPVACAQPARAEDNVSKLIASLASGDAKAQAEAAAGLGKLGAAALPAVPTLHSVAAGKDEAAVKAAKEALKAIVGKDDKPVTTDSGLQYIDFKEGQGAAAKAGETVEVHYTGWLTDGSKFDSSRDRNEPFEFPLGARRVIKGWDEGVAGMKPGQRRLLIIPAALGYGARGAGGVIPPNATLIFDVELRSSR